jgi:general secretion pathway protein L
LNKQLIIFADNDETFVVNWALINPVTQQVIDNNCSPVDEILDHYKNDTDIDLHLIFSGFDASLKYADIPAKTEVQARAAVPFIFEDDLSAPPETLHFAIGPAIENNTRPVFVIAQDIMNRWISTINDSDMSLSGAFVDIDCLRKNKTTAIYEKPDGNFIIITNEGMAATVEADIFDLIAPDFFKNINEPIPTYARTAPTPTLANEQTLEQHAPLSIVDFFLHFSASITSGKPVNLLQGNYISRKSMQQIWLTWKRPAIFFSTLILAFIGYYATESWQLSQTIARLDQETKTTMKLEFPGVSSINQVRARIRASQTNATDRFILLSAILFDSVQENEDISIISTRYDESRGELSVSLNTKSFNDVETLKNSMSRRGAGLTEGASRQIDGRIVADVIVRESIS